MSSQVRHLGFVSWRDLSLSGETVSHKRTHTAELVAFARAAGTYERDATVRNPDTLAPVLISRRHRIGLLPGIRQALGAVYERICPGMYLYHQARTQFFDSVLHQELAGGLDQLVILGAGLDSRAYRFARQLADVRVYEVDHPGTSALKQQRLKRWGGATEHVSFVPVDFTCESLDTALAKHGFDFQARSFFLWEGVSYYLSDVDVRRTLAVLGRAPSGSAVAFDYVVEDALVRPQAYLGGKEFFSYVMKRGEPVLSGLHPDKMDVYLSPYGFAAISNVSIAELEALYLTPGSREDCGRACGVFGMVHARKL